MRRQFLDMLGGRGSVKLTVTGYNDRTNDVLYCPSLQNKQPMTITVFFGGDIQVKYFNCTIIKACLIYLTIII